MTIAAGLRCSGGIVFGADTEETFGDIRNRVNKIVSLIDPLGGSTTVITGACNNVHAMDAAIERIFDSVISKKPTHNHVLGQLLRNVLMKLYAEDLRVYPGDAVSVDLLIAAKLPSEQCVEVWSTHSSVVRKMHAREVLGVGGLVEYILDYLYTYQMPLDDGVLAMAQLLTFAKKHVGSIGGDSYVSFLCDDGTWHEENLTFSPGREGVWDYFLSRGRQLLLATGKKSLK